MALTVSVKENYVAGNKRVVRGTLTPDTSYPTGGYAFLPATVGMDVFDRILFDDTLGFAFNFDAVNNKVKVFYAQAAGVATVNTTGVATTTGGTVNTLMSYTLPASALASNAQSINIEAWGTTTATAGTKTIALLLGSQTILAPTGAANNNVAWWFSALVVRTGAATQEVIAQSTIGASITGPTRTAGTQTLTSGVIISCTGLPNATADVVTQTGLLVTINGTATGAAGLETLNGTDLSGIGAVTFSIEGA